MDIPSLHEVHEWLDESSRIQLPAAETYYTHVDVKIVNDLKAAVDELRTTVRELERKHAAMEDRLQKYESDGR